MVERLERGNPFQWPFLFCVTRVTHRGQQPWSPPPFARQRLAAECAAAAATVSDDGAAT